MLAFRSTNIVPSPGKAARRPFPAVMVTEKCFDVGCTDSFSHQYIKTILCQVTYRRRRVKDVQKIFRDNDIVASLFRVFERSEFTFWVRLGSRTNYKSLRRISLKYLAVLVLITRPNNNTVWWCSILYEDVLLYIGTGKRNPPLAIPNWVIYCVLERRCCSPVP